VNSFITLENKSKWDETYLSLPINLQDVYYTSEYYQICENNSDSKAGLYIYKEQEKILFYPFLKTLIDPEYTNASAEYYDIEGAYGYNGPLVNATDEEFIKNAAKDFCEKCKAEKIVAEFTRYNPVIRNQDWLGHITPLVVSQNIVLDLSIENIWMDAYEHSTRKNINKAERNGLSTYYKNGKDLSAEEMNFFLSVYYDTMKRNNAQKSYYFSEKYFSRIAQLQNRNPYFFFTTINSKIISCELVMLGSEIAYSFLGGTLSEYFSLRANDILKHKIVNTLKELNLRYFCLGGGTTPNDGIFNYKKCFSKNGTVDFFIGKKIHNEFIYHTVVKNWEAKFPEKKEVFKNHLLKYKN
jgi:hypothetical protein